jgi:hypothetical protein
MASGSTAVMANLLSGSSDMFMRHHTVSGRTVGMADRLSGGPVAAQHGHAHRFRIIQGG